MFIGDDDEFGDFNFVSSVPSHHEDDEWGDFVATSLQSDHGFSSFVDNPSDPTRPKGWEKPTGALPLSLFGEEEEEPEPALDGGSVFGTNGFHSSSKITKDGAGLKDIIASLYGQEVKNADLDDEEDGWEFKEASSSGDGIQEGKKVEDTSNGGVLIAAGRLEDHQGTSISLKEHDQADFFATDYGFTNGLKFFPDVAQNHCNLDVSMQTKCVENGNGVSSNLEHVDTSADEKGLNFKDVNGPFMQQKNPDSKLQVAASGDKTQGPVNTWKNGMDEFPIFNYCNGKGDFSLQSGDFKEYTSKPASVGIETNQIVISLQGGPKKWENNMDELAIFTQSNSKGDNNWQNGDLYEFSSEPASLGYANNIFSSFDLIPDLIVKPGQDIAVSTKFGPSEYKEYPSSSPVSITINGDSDFDDSNWEFQAASEKTNVETDHSTVFNNEHLSTDTIQSNVLNFYFRLKEASLCLAGHHLDDLKEAHEGAALSGEQSKAIKLNEEIQVVSEKLKQDDLAIDVFKGKYPSKHVCASQLLEVVKKQDVEPFAQEFHLLEQISSAEKDLVSAIKLFEHTTLVLHVLAQTSREMQQAYLMAWSRLADACARELQHGDVIWKESVRMNVHKQILSQGSQYFVALGEIYFVAETLKASLKLYKPWILLNQALSSNIATNLDMCDEAWSKPGLESALETISEMMDLNDTMLAKNLLKSIKFIEGLDESTLRNHQSGHGKQICRLSLFPTEMIQGLKGVDWNGEHYILTVANLWANKVSSDPPQLPRIDTS
ncbi:hypothetical protein J5N97_018046 [Dioscorea zingiberensis]|uniref:Synergin gamma C-terminal domain-containing protein n=1 Tax=Dioscorea zingiberensis TaxID=325984 RepID=A0A9D5HGS4_9LILI|nr:hypothetical protein J5N97_018046 [Dioscorea zingiberensis]